jgi:hypothetical protein
MMCDFTEEAVNEVKRQAVIELQRAVSAAETKAAELIAAERSRMEKLLLEARKQAAASAASDDASSAPATHHADSGEVRSLLHPFKRHAIE